MDKALIIKGQQANTKADNWRILCRAYNELAREISRNIGDSEFPQTADLPQNSPLQVFTQTPQDTPSNTITIPSVVDIDPIPLPLPLPKRDIQESFSSIFDWIAESAENASHHVKNWASNTTENIKIKVHNLTKEFGDGMTKPVRDAHSTVQEFFYTLWWWTKATLLTILGVLSLSIVVFLGLKGYAMFLIFRRFWRGINWPWRIMGINVVETEPNPNHRDSYNGSDIEMSEFSIPRNSHATTDYYPVHKARPQIRSARKPPIRAPNSKRRYDSGESLSPPPRYSRKTKTPSAPLRKSFSPESKR